MSDWGRTLAMMYAQNQPPQLQVRSPQPVTLPPIGETKGPSAWDAFGTGLGKGMEQGASKVMGGVIDMKMDVKRQEYMMKNSPETSFKMMGQAHEMFNSMPEALQSKVQDNPEFQRRLATWAIQFPGNAPIYSEPDTGQMRFTLKSKTVEQQKAGALESMGEGTPGSPSSNLRQGLLFSRENKDIATSNYYGAKATEVPYEIDKTIAEARAREAATRAKDAATPFIAPLAQSEIDYRKQMGTAAELNARTRQETPEEATKRALAVEKIRLDREEKRLNLREDLATRAEALKERQAAQKQADTEMRAAQVAFSTNVRGRQTATNIGKMSDNTNVVLKNADDTLTLIDTTGHLPFFNPDGSFTKYGTIQMNYAHNALDQLSTIFDKAVAAGEPESELNRIRAKAESIYDRFQLNSGKGNLLDDRPTLKAMNKMRTPKTVKSRAGKEYIVPNDMGIINQFLTKEFGRSTSWNPLDILK